MEKSKNINYSYKNAKLSLGVSIASADEAKIFIGLMEEAKHDLLADFPQEEEVVVPATEIPEVPEAPKNEDDETPL